MISYTLDKTKPDSLYIQLYKLLKKDMEEGKFKSGERLPSKRNFSANLGVSLITVENAYEQLVTEGYVFTVEKKGYFVSELKEQGNRDHGFIPADSIGAEKGPETKGTVDFSSNVPSVEQFPFGVWARILRHVIGTSQQSLLSEQNPQGNFGLRKAIAMHLRSFRGMDVRPEQIVVGSGTENLYSRLVQLLGKDKVYGIEDPGYRKISLIYGANRVRTEFISMEKDGIRISELEEKDVSVAHISPGHQFPTGIITPIGKRYEILAWASRSPGRYIIEDDYDSEFRMTGLPVPTLQSIDTQERVIYMNTFSKTLSPAMRVNYMILPPHLLNLYRTTMGFCDCPVSALMQISVAEFINSGFFEKHINRMRTFYKKQRNLLLSELKKCRFAGRISISEENSGLHFIMRLDIGCSDREFKERLREKGLEIRCLAEFCRKPSRDEDHLFVVNYSSMDAGKIMEAVRILDETAASFA